MATTDPTEVAGLIAKGAWAARARTVRKRKGGEQILRQLHDVYGWQPDPVPGEGPWLVSPKAPDDWRKKRGCTYSPAEFTIGYSNVRHHYSLGARSGGRPERGLIVHNSMSWADWHLALVEAIRKGRVAL